MHTNPQSLINQEESSIKDESPRGSIGSDEGIEAWPKDAEEQEEEKKAGGASGVNSEAEGNDSERNEED